MASAAPLTPKRANTRQRLLEAAMVVFAAKGVLGASVEEICDQAGFTRGAFYSNFASKEELCLALIEHFAAQMYAEISQLMDTPLTSLDQLWELAAKLFLHSRSLTPQTVLVELELRLFAVREQAVRQAYLELNRQTLEQFAQLVTGAMAQVGVRWRLPGIDALKLLQATFEQQAIDALLDDVDLTGERLRRQLGTLLLGLTEPV